MREIAEQAAEWIVMLSADDAAEREHARAGFEAWKRADPRHAGAAAGIEDFVEQVRSVRAGSVAGTRPARAALGAALGASDAAPRRRARRIGTACALAIALALPCWLALRAFPPAELMADLRTPTGQWRTQLLTDGTRITLGSGSAVNLRYDERRRAIELVGGDILVDVAKDASRPFVVETAEGSIRALGTRLVVGRQADATVLTMIESRVSVQTAAQRRLKSDEATTVAAGQRVRITPDGVGAVETVDARSVADAWTYRQLVVQGVPLPEVLDALSRQRPGRIQYDRAALQDIRVSAVLPLDDTDRALQLLVTSFPKLRVRSFTPYWVLVDAPRAP